MAEPPLISRWSTIYGDLLRKPAGWLVAVLFYIVSIPVFHWMEQPDADLGYYEYMAINELLSIIMWMVFIIPLLRYLLRDHIEMGRARWGLWLLVALGMAVLLWALIYVGEILLTLFWPSLGVWLGYQWLEYLLYTVIAPFFLGIYIWEAALICGTKAPSLRQALRFVRQEGKLIFLLYFALSCTGIVVTYAISLAAQGMEPLIVTAMFNVRYALFVWLMSLFTGSVMALMVKDEKGVESVFE